MPPQVHFLDPSIACLYRPSLMQKAPGKCCENQPLSRNRERVKKLVDLEIG